MFELWLHLNWDTCCFADNFPLSSFDFSVKECQAGGSPTGPPTKLILPFHREPDKKLKQHMASLNWLKSNFFSINKYVILACSKVLHRAAQPPLLAIAHGSSSLPSTPTASRFLWGYSSMLDLQLGCVCLLTHSVTQPHPLLAGFDWQQHEPMASTGEIGLR